MEPGIKSVRIWVDADACPQPVRDIIIRAAHKRRVGAIFVTNKALALPISEYLSCVQVKQGPDMADLHIVERAEPGDLAVTQDIPLAASLVAKGVTVIGPRGDRFTADNMAETLARRNLLQDLRDTGEITGGGPRPFDERAKREFASLFDAALGKLLG